MISILKEKDIATMENGDDFLVFKVLEYDNDIYYKMINLKDETKFCFAKEKILGNNGLDLQFINNEKLEKILNGL